MGFLKVQFVAKYQKRRGPFGEVKIFSNRNGKREFGNSLSAEQLERGTLWRQKKIKKKLHRGKKTQRGPIVSSGFVS